jgi:hypothetical protein
VSKQDREPPGSAGNGPVAAPDDDERSPLVVIRPFTGGGEPVQWRCPAPSCGYRELGRVERPGGEGICPVHQRALTLSDD